MNSQHRVLLHQRKHRCGLLLRRLFARPGELVATHSIPHVKQTALALKVGFAVLLHRHKRPGQHHVSARRPHDGSLPGTQFVGRPSHTLRKSSRPLCSHFPESIVASCAPFPSKPFLASAKPWYERRATGVWAARNLPQWRDKYHAQHADDPMMNHRHFLACPKRANRHPHPLL